MSMDHSTLGDDRVLELLAAFDDALAAGRNAPADGDAGPSGLQQVDRGRACIKLLREVFASHASDTAVGERDPGSPREPSTALPFQQLGRYQIRRELGQGSCGIVFLAYDPQLRRETALKVPRGEALLTPSLRERFLREARAAAVLNHPNIIAVHEAGEVGPVCYIAAEYCPGVTLSVWLKRHAELVLSRDAAAFLLTLAQAVQHAHERGVLHRDLKPSNIMLLEALAGDQELIQDRPLGLLTPKITDFSLAKFIQSDEAGQTHSGDIVGTPQYMAPEQAGGKGNAAGPAADVYALGAVLYELLTGRPPFKGETSLDTLQQVLQVEPIAPRRLNAKVPRDLEIVCLKCLEKEPHRRYAGAAALADDLSRFLADRPIVARPSGRLELAGRWCRRNPALATACLLAVAGLFGITSVSVLYAVSMSRHARELDRGAFELRETLRISEKHRQKSELRLAENYLERGRSFGDEGLGTAAILFLSRALEVAPTNAEDVREAARKLIGSFGGKLHVPSTVLDPSGQIGAVAWSADGKMIAAGRLDGTIRLWAVHAADRHVDLVGHGARIRALDFSPDGRTLLSGSDDGTARLWNVVASRAVGAPLSHGAAVLSVNFSPDGQRALSGSVDGAAKLWEVSSGRPVREAIIHRGGIGRVRFDAKGDVFITSGGGRCARFWDARSGQQLGTPLQHEGVVYAVAMSPDSRLVLTGSEDHTARLWDRSTGKPIGRPLQHEYVVRVVNFSPDGRQFVTASADGIARIWDSATGEPIGKPLAHQLAISAAAFSPDGSTLLTGSDDRTARLWDLRTREQIGLPLQHAGEVWEVAFRPDGRVLTWGLDDPIRLWDITATAPASTSLLHSHWVAAVAYSPDGKMLLTGTSNATNSTGELRLWDAATFKTIGPARSQPMPIMAVAFSPDGKRYLSGTGNLFLGRGEAQLWDVNTGGPVGQPIRHEKVITAVTFSPDGMSFLTASRDRTARLWNTSTRDEIRTFQHEDGVTGAAFSADGKVLLTGCEDKTARLWDVATGRVVGEPLRHQATVLGVALSPDGRTALTGCLDHTAQLWDTRSCKPLGSPLRHKSWVAALAFSPDGLTALTGSADNTIQLWDTHTRRPIGIPLRHQSGVVDAVFSPDGGTILSASTDMTARLWSVQPAVEGEAERVTLWAQVVTGAELDDSDVVRVLNPAMWHERRRRLEKLGGSPLTR
jgi:eukaryotic-like serine/threonine-protein kinase